MLITHKNQYVQDEDHIYFPDCSIGFSTANNLYIVTKELLTDLQVNFKSGLDFSPYLIEAGSVVPVDELNITNVSKSSAGGYHIYKINLFCYNETPGEYTDSLFIQYGTESGSFIYKVTCHAEIEGINAETTVTLQNMKRFITEEYMEAMKETDWQASEIDFTIYNRKVREYLMNILSIDAFMGSYRGLDAILNFFGYGELLDLREYWFSQEDDSYKWTSIKTVINKAIDKSLSGFKKSNQLALVYQINEADGVDADGLPIYVNVLDQTDEILFKLWTLERILERDFLFLNSHIVDIIGEFQTVMGLEFNVVLNDIEVNDIFLSEEITGTLKIFQTKNDVDGILSDPNHITDDNYSLDKYAESMTGDAASTENLFIPIIRHSVLLHEPFAYEGGTELTIVDGAVSGHMNKDVFDITKEVKADEDLAETYAYLTKYYNGDFGLIDFTVIVDASKYQAYKYVVLVNDTNEVLFESDRKVVDTNTLNILCGVRQTGKFNVIVYLLDYFGGYSAASVDQIIEIDYKKLDIKIGVYGFGHQPHNIKMWTTFQDTTGMTQYPVVDSIAESVDFSAISPVARYNESDFDMLSTWTNLNQLNGIPLKAMKGLPLYIHGFLYNVFVYDIIGNGLAGDRQLALSLFEHKPKDIVALPYDGTEEPVEYLQRLINLLNSQNSDGPFGKFNWDIHWYSNDPTATIAETSPMLRGKAKEASFKKNNYFVDLNVDYATVDFPTAYYQRDVRLFSKTDATLTFPYLQEAVNQDFSITYQGVTNFYNAISIRSIEELRTTIEQFIDDYALEGIKVSQYGNVIQIFAAGDISISSGTFGTQSDTQRGVFNDNIVHIPVGSDIRLGEPVFAFIDEEFRIDVADVTWTLIDTLTGKEITQQHAWAFRWVMVQEGTYSLKLKTTYRDGASTTSIAHGVYLVRGYVQDPEGINFMGIGIDFVVQ